MKASIFFLFQKYNYYNHRLRSNLLLNPISKPYSSSQAFSNIQTFILSLNETDISVTIKLSLFILF